MMGKLDKFLGMFKGPSNTYDAARVLFAFGGVTGTLAPVVFQSVALWKGQTWDALSFSSGEGLILSSFAAVGFGIRQKDRGVADAQATMADTENKTP